MSEITGGEPVKKVQPVSDQDMKAIESLKNAGVGQRDLGPAAWNAIVDERKRRNGSRAERYAQFANTCKDLMHSSNPAVQREWAAKNRQFHNAVTSSDVHGDTFLSNVSTQYGNDEFIGEMLAPPVLVGKKSDEFPTYGKRDRLALPDDDSIAEGGETPEVEETRGKDSYSCTNRGFKSSIDADVLANQDAPLDEMFDLIEGLAERRALAREIRIANVLTTAGNYASGNKVTLSGSDQWNSAAGGAPIKNIQDAVAALWRGRAPAKTCGFTSLENYNVLARHPDVLGLFLYGGEKVGLATPGMIAEYLGLDELFVGKSRYDSANEAASATYSRVWGDFFGVARVADRASLRSATFCLTMRWLMQGVPGANGGILTQQWFDERKGLGGSYFAKVGESEAHKVQASDAGYLISDCLA